MFCAIFVLVGVEVESGEPDAPANITGNGCVEDGYLVIWLAIDEGRGNWTGLRAIQSLRDFLSIIYLIFAACLRGRSCPLRTSMLKTQTASDMFEIAPQLLHKTRDVTAGIVWLFNVVSSIVWTDLVQLRF